VVASILASVAACGTEVPSGSPTATSSTATPVPTAEAKPPVEAIALEPRFGPSLNGLGLVLTARGGLIDRSGGGYRKSSSGTHLALYVEPAGPYTEEQYVDGILAVTKVFAPDVFDRWPGIESFDVCQEPPPRLDDREERDPVTQIELTRDQGAAIDWATVSVADLIAASRQDPAELRLVVSPALADSEAYARLAVRG